jgi:hypothetical protein
MLNKGRQIDNVLRSGSVTTRFSELEREGKIRAVKIRPCKITGRDAWEYEILNSQEETPTRNKLQSTKSLLREITAKVQEMANHLEEQHSRSQLPAKWIEWKEETKKILEIVNVQNREKKRKAGKRTKPENHQGRMENPSSHI